MFCGGRHKLVGLGHFSSGYLTLGPTTRAGVPNLGYMYV